MPAKSFLTGLLILAVWGCQSTPPDRGPEPPADIPATTDPDQLAQRAAAASGRQAAVLYLDAASLYFQDGRVDAARETLGMLDTDRLPERQLGRYLLLSGRLATLSGDYREARAVLSAVDAELLADPLLLDLAEAELLAAEDQPLAAAQRLMRANVPDARVQPVNDTIWGYLNQVPPLDPARPAPDASAEERGWLELRHSMLTSLGLDDQTERLGAWQAAWPEHPATRHPPDALTTLVDPDWRPTRVGLLLPLSGPLAQAGRAVRDGFIATYLRFGRTIGYELTLYDTAGDSIGNLYEQALVDGMDILVGPLLRDNVAQMNRLNPELPVLALNYLTEDGEDAPSPRLLQLGLAIEDEARSIASRLERDGVRRLLLVRNDEEWAIRAANALKSAWSGPPDEPHALTEQQILDLKTITESVGAAMFVNDSEDRKAGLEELLREDLEFLPRARADVDAVVALVTNLEANALVPALHFHSARDVPVYTSSQSLRGARPADLRELEGFRVSELPWFVEDDETYREMHEAFALDENPMSSLYALGVDAFRVADRLPLLAEGARPALLGSTGGLLLGPDGRFARELAWARVTEGRAVAAPWTSSP